MVVHRSKTKLHAAENDFPRQFRLTTMAQEQKLFNGFNE